MTPNHPKWYEVALAEVGTTETAGPASTARILEYFGATNHGAKDDETPWCSAFVNWCFKQAGITGTLSAGARSWTTWGQELKTPVVGCVVVFGYPNTWHGHVGFYAGEANNSIRVYGGNQSNKVCTIGMDKKLLLSYRWPNGVDIPNQYAPPQSVTPSPIVPDGIYVKTGWLREHITMLSEIRAQLESALEAARSLTTKEK